MFITNAFLDWQNAFDKLLEHTKPQRVLEFGMGEGTQYLLDHFTHVTSVELCPDPEKEAWYNKCVEMYKDAPSWQHFLFNCEDVYTEDLRRYIHALVADQGYDLIFVDPGVHCRGEIVSQCFFKAPIIIAHDTNFGNDVYGWDRIEVPAPYTKVVYPTTQGVTFWFKDEGLAKEMQG